MKQLRLPLLAIASSIALNIAAASAQTNSAGAVSASSLQPRLAASFPGPVLRSDLVAESQGAQFGFRVRNIGSGKAPDSITLITCTAYVAATPTKIGGGYVPCVEGTHYVTLPGVPIPAGTAKGGNVWKVPTPALAANTGQMAFTLNIKTTPAQRTRGLNFQVCADANTAIAESNESNNCQAFNYTWPN